MPPTRLPPATREPCSLPTSSCLLNETLPDALLYIGADIDLRVVQLMQPWETRAILMEPLESTEKDVDQHMFETLIHYRQMHKSDPRPAYRETSDAVRKCKKRRTPGCELDFSRLLRDRLEQAEGIVDVQVLRNITPDELYGHCFESSRTMHGCLQKSAHFAFKLRGNPQQKTLRYVIPQREASPRAWRGFARHFRGTVSTLAAQGAAGNIGEFIENVGERFWPSCLTSVSLLAGKHEREFVSALGTLVSESRTLYPFDDTLTGRRLEQGSGCDSHNSDVASILPTFLTWRGAAPGGCEELAVFCVTPHNSVGAASVLGAGGGRRPRADVPLWKGRSFAATNSDAPFGRRLQRLVEAGRRLAKKKALSTAEKLRQERCLNFGTCTPTAAKVEPIDPQALAKLAPIELFKPPPPPAILTQAAPGAKMCFGGSSTCKHPTDLVPRHFGGSGLIAPVPRQSSPFAQCCATCDAGPSMCSNSRVEELVVIDLFLPHLLSSGPTPASDGKARTYLEIGANDGLHASNTLYLSNCLRWEGILIEAHPVLHTRIMANRPSTVSINTAVCTQHQVVQFSAEPVPGGSMLDTKTLQPLTQSAGAAMTLQKQIQQTDWSAVAEGWDEPPEEVVSTQRIANATIEVACGPLQYYLDLLGVSTLHFFSLDVEGAEAHVVNSIDWKRTTVAILVVEESTRTPSMRSKNAKVQGVLKSEARMRQVYKHCIHSQLCDTYWVNPKLIDVKGLEGSLAALNTQGNRTYKAKLLRDRMGTHIMRNNERCGRLKEEEEQEEVKVKGAAKPRARRKEKHHPEKRNRLLENHKRAVARAQALAQHKGQAHGFQWQQAADSWMLWLARKFGA